MTVLVVAGAVGAVVVVFNVNVNVGCCWGCNVEPNVDEVPPKLPKVFPVVDEPNVEELNPPKVDCCGWDPNVDEPNVDVDAPKPVVPPVLEPNPPNDVEVGTWAFVCVDPNNVDVPVFNDGNVKLVEAAVVVVVGFVDDDPNEKPVFWFDPSIFKIILFKVVC